MGEWLAYASRAARSAGSLRPSARTEMRCCATLAGAEEEVHDELVELLVASAAGGERVGVDGVVLEGCGVVGAVAVGGGGAVEGVVHLPELVQHGGDGRVGVELAHLLFQDEVGAHAALCELPDAVLVLGAVGVGVEVARAVVAVVLEELDQEEGALGVL